MVSLVLLLSPQLNKEKQSAAADTKEPLVTASILNSHGNLEYGSIRFFSDVVFVDFKDGERFSIFFSPSNINGTSLGPFSLETVDSNVLSSLKVSLSRQREGLFRTRMVSHYSLFDGSTAFAVNEAWQGKAGHLWSISSPGGKCVAALRSLPDSKFTINSKRVCSFHLLLNDRKWTMLPILLCSGLYMQQLNQIPGGPLYKAPQEASGVSKEIDAFIQESEKDEFFV